MSRGGSIKVWDLPKNGGTAVVLRFESRIVGVRSVKLSPDDRYIAAGVFDDGSVRLLDAVTGQQIRSVRLSIRVLTYIHIYMSV
jgi:WD40 repeat protein